MKNEILSRLQHFDGHIGFYYKNLITGEVLCFHEKERFMAASVIKLPLLVGMLLKQSLGETDFSQKLLISEKDKVPGCGAIQHMTGQVELDIASIYRLMITISDNTATNVLAEHYGIESMKKVFAMLGMEKTRFNRKLYDFEKESLGIQNWIVPEEMGILLEKMYQRTLIDEKTSVLLEDILLQQQIEHKIPSRLPVGTRVAHKTGEEDGTTHDVGIVYAKKPFVVCFASNKTDVPEFEDFIRKTSYELYCDASQ